MEKPTVVHSTFTLERKLKASPERVFAAFADPVAKRRWFYESTTHELQHHELDFKVGGREQAKMKFNGGPIAGKTIVNDTLYEDIRPNRRMVTAYRMDLDEVPMSVSLATFELVPTDGGTVLLLTHQGAYFENSDGPEMRKGGWEHLLSKLVTELGE
jgi:uncharacterized protein YndB with AHSA1/START domain